MGQKKITKLWDVQLWCGHYHVATLHWQKPYALAKSLKRMADLTRPTGHYTKLVNR